MATGAGGAKDAAAGGLVLGAGKRTAGDSPVLRLQHGEGGEEQEKAVASRHFGGQA